MYKLIKKIEGIEDKINVYEKRYDEYNELLEVNLENYGDEQEKKKYLYKQKAILETKIFASGFWSVIGIIVSILALVFEIIDMDKAVVLIIIIFSALLCLNSIYRNEVSAEAKLKIKCIDKWINEISQSTNTTIKIKKSITHSNNILNVKK